MERWFEFMGRHPFLFGTLFALMVMYFMLETRRSGKKISPNAIGMMVNEQNAQLIDIRSKKEFEAGHIKGSRNIPFAEFKNHLDSLKTTEEPIVVVCQIGMTSGAAVALLGKDNVYRLDGGISNWQASGLPLVKSP